MIDKYGHLGWWIALACVALALLGGVIGFFFSGGNEADRAFADGRRLVIAIDTGEIAGKMISLDAPAPAAPKTAEPPPEIMPVEPTEEPQVPTLTPSAESPPPPDATAPSPTAGTEEEPANPTAAPNPDLTETTEAGTLPIIGKEGLKPWRYYSKSFERKRNQPMVAILITGLGISDTITQSAVDLPHYVSFSFSPYTRTPEVWSKAVRANGHEMLVDLPLEPANYPVTDPGPRALLLEKGRAEATKNLLWTLSRFSAFIGITTSFNDAYTSNDDAMKLLLQTVENRGLLMVIPRDPARKETRDLVEASQAATLIADVFIDEELTPGAIQTRLLQLEDEAKKKGYAVGIAQAYPLTIEQIKIWSQTLSERGVMLVPVSAIAKLRYP